MLDCQGPDYFKNGFAASTNYFYNYSRSLSGIGAITCF
jgi:hypothetical protein